MSFYLTQVNILTDKEIEEILDMFTDYLDKRRLSPMNGPERLTVKLFLEWYMPKKGGKS
jgi:hypothetical protein